MLLLDSLELKVPESDLESHLASLRHIRVEDYYLCLQGKIIPLKKANKVMHLSAIDYKLKKYLKFITKTSKSAEKALASIVLEIKQLFKVVILILSTSNFSVNYAKY